VAWVNGGWWWLLLWPAVSFLVLAWAYYARRPGVLGKRPGGSIHPAVFVMLLPYFGLTWTVWHATRLMSRDGAGHEVAPGLYVGRRPYAADLPPDTRLVIDMTGEFLPARGTRAVNGRSYLCVPTLDGSAPPESVLPDVLGRIAACRDEGGSVYIHCAQGRGRSAAVAAAVLIAQGVAADVAEAERLISRSRRVRLNAAQRAWVGRVIAALRNEKGPAGAGSVS
jgi:protein-tyrosine phosphatase